MSERTATPAIKATSKSNGAAKGRRSRSPAARAMRRSAIIDAAAKTFAKLGYAETEMEQIADRIGIAKGTLYLYFESKRELFFACADDGMRQMQQAVIAATDPIAEPFAKIAASVRAFLIFFDEHPHFVELFIQERASFKDRKRPTYFEHRDANRGPWREIYRQLADAGKIRGDIPVEQLMDAGSNLMFGAMYTNRFIGRKISVDEQAHILTQFMFQGLIAKPD